MSEQTNAMATCFVNLNELEYIQVEILNSEYVIILKDLKGDEILKGYGSSAIEAFNDLHHNVI